MSNITKWTDVWSFSLRTSRSMASSGMAMRRSVRTRNAKPVIFIAELARMAADSSYVPR